MIDQLDAVQEAFEPISVADVTLEALTQAVSRLLQLEFLPKFKGLNARYEEKELVEAANRFTDLDPALQEATLDCVVAISKISMHLMHAIFADNQVTRYEKNAKA